MHRKRLWRRGGLAVAFVALLGLAISVGRGSRSDAGRPSAGACPTGYSLVAEAEAAEHRAGIPGEVESRRPRSSPTARASTRPSTRRS